jgi:hypothetical protein
VGVLIAGALETSHGLETPENIDPTRLFCGPFHLLSGLKDIYLTKSRPQAERGETSAWVSPSHPQGELYGIVEARDHIAKVFALRNEGWLSGKPPNVVIRPWKCLPGVEMPEA